MENMQLIHIFNTPIISKLLGTLSFQGWVRIEEKNRDINNLTTQYNILHLG